LAHGTNRKKPRKRIYHLLRRDDERYINDYSPALLIANQANIDVQYIGHLGSKLPYYITDYMTKAESVEIEAMWEEVNNACKSLGQRTMSYLLKSIKTRQVGAVEAADRLLGTKLYSISRQFRYIDLAKKSEVKRTLRRYEELEKLAKNDPQSSDLYIAHWVIDIYPKRPEHMENISLFQLLSWYERERNGTDDNMMLTDGSFYLRKRLFKPYIIQHRKVNPFETDEKKNAYYGDLLKLFKPWRNENELVVSGNSNYETYCVESVNYPDMVAYHEKFVVKRKSDIEFEERVRERAKEILKAENIDENIEDDPENAIQGGVIDRAADAMEDLLDANKQILNGDTEDRLKNDYESLNIDQKRVVDKILDSVTKRNGATSLKLIVSGCGGTGKSRVISVVRRLLCNKFKNEDCPVVVMAPTGIAAHSINGLTIHSCLSLAIDQENTTKYTPLSTEKLLTLRKTLKETRLFIIDEISMVSSLLLTYIHLRLSEILAVDLPMGNANCVFLGDFLQLRPVSGNPPYMPLTRLEVKNRIGSVGTFNLWHLFEYEELSINVRQKMDKSYANTLAEIRQGFCTGENLNSLYKRKIGNSYRASNDEIIDLYSKLYEEGNRPVILMPTNENCMVVNDLLLTKSCSDYVKLSAVDRLSSVVDDKRIEQKAANTVLNFGNDKKRTAGSFMSLLLAVGARVMLQRNICVAKGLVNGSMGTVTSFKLLPNGEIIGVLVKFDGLELPVEIGRETVRFEVLKQVFFTRRQFPLQLAFAITIHKSQGLSLQCAIVDAGNRCFGPGMLYVALSRVTTSAGLHLVEFDKTKIYCDVDALIEYNRLRQIYRTDLPLFEFPERQLRGTPDEVCITNEVNSKGQQTQGKKISIVGGPRKRMRSPSVEEPLLIEIYPKHKKRITSVGPVVSTKEKKLNINAKLDHNDIFRVIQPAQDRQEQHKNANNANAPASAYVTLDSNRKVSRIIHADWNQAEDNIFLSGYAGSQCFAMVLANIVRAAIIPPRQWNKNILNRNMIEGDTIYALIRENNNNRNPRVFPIPPSGYLVLKNLDVIKDDFLMYDAVFSLNYDDNWLCSGSLLDSINNGELGITLLAALKKLFREHNAGIIVAYSKSLGLMHYDEKYYFTDSHSCGPRGAPLQNDNGKACVIECDTIEELYRITRRVFKAKNEQFTIHYIDVTVSTLKDDH